MPILSLFISYRAPRKLFIFKAERMAPVSSVFHSQVTPFFSILFGDPISLILMANKIDQIGGLTYPPLSTIDRLLSEGLQVSWLF